MGALLAASVLVVNGTNHRHIDWGLDMSRDRETVDASRADVSGHQHQPPVKVA
jgi:hypothetical protein